MKILGNRRLYAVCQVAMIWKNDHDQTKAKLDQDLERRDYVSAMEWYRMEKMATFQFIAQRLSKHNPKLWGIFTSEFNLENTENLEMILCAIKTYHKEHVRWLCETFSTDCNGHISTRQAELKAVQELIRLGNIVEKYQ